MKKKTLSCVCGAASALLFLLMLGIVGGIEHDTIPLLKGTLLLVTTEAAWAGTLYLGGFLR